MKAINGLFNRILIADHCSTTKPQDAAISRYASYLSSSSKQSLLKDFISWILYNIILILIITISYPLLLLYIIVKIRSIFKLINIYTIYLIMAIILPSLYYFHLIFELFSIHYHVDAMYTIIPFLLSIMFRDAIIAASNLRYNLKQMRKIKMKKQKDYYEQVKQQQQNRKNINHNDNGIPLINDITDDTSHITDDTSHTTFDDECKYDNEHNANNENWFQKMIRHDFNKFITDYSIWGVSLINYEPFSSLTLSGEHNDDKKRMCSVLFGELFPIINKKEERNKIHFAEYYKKSDRCFQMIQIFLAVFFAIFPTIFFWKDHMAHDEFRWSGIMAFFGMFFLIFVSMAINGFIEIIFYELSKYSNYMRVLTNLLQIKDADCDVFKLFASVDYDVINVSDMASREERILLYEGENCTVWFENWARIQHIVSTYFANRENFVFGLFTSLFACIVCILYFYIINNIINTISMSIFCGFIYSFIVLVRLLINAMKLSSLQSKQIELITLQQRYLKEMILVKKQKGLLRNRYNLKDDELKKRTQAGDPIQKVYYNFLDDDINSYLTFVIKSIEDRSVCPKIADVELNEALVKMAVSTLVGLASFAITYLVHHIKSL